MSNAATELRLYTFVNFYLSSIQQGIQSAHVAVELFNEYPRSDSKAAKLLRSWAQHGKTMIVLNGGAAVDVATSYEGAESFGAHVPYPFAAFYEEPGAVHESRVALTAWGVVLPPEVYNAKPVEAFPNRVGFSTTPQDQIELNEPIWAPGSFEHFICSCLQGKGLAR